MDFFLSGVADRWVHQSDRTPCQWRSSGISRHWKVRIFLNILLFGKL